MVSAPAKASSGSRAAAVGFFALLPIAVAIGVVVGRADSGGGDEGALLEALRRQDAAAATSGPTTASSTGPKNAAKAKDSGKQPKKGEGKVVAETDNGTVHALTGFKASEEKEAEDTQLVEENPEQVGKRLHHGPAEPPRRDRRRRRPQRSPGALRADRASHERARRTGSCAPSATACSRSSR